MKSYLSYVSGVLLSASLLTACGSDNSNNGQPIYPVNAVASCQGSCPTPDLVQTSMGCLPQAGCAICSGSNNGACMPGVASLQNGYGGQYGGVPGYPYGFNPEPDPHHHHDHDGW